MNEIFTIEAGFVPEGGPGYDSNHLNRLNARHRVLIEPFASQFAGARVLDLASHDGRWTYAVLKTTEATHVTGIEARPELIAMSSLIITEAMRPRCNFVAADMFEQLPAMIRDGDRYDIVLCFGFFYHTMEHYRLLSLIAALRPKLILLDTGLIDSDEPAIKLKREDSDLITSIAPAAIDNPVRDLTIGIPSRGALDLMAADLGLTVDYLPWRREEHPDRSGLFDYFNASKFGAKRYSAMLTFREPEATIPTHYFKERGLEEAVAAGDHREAIGGLWEEMGRWQFDFLIEQGLKPHHFIVDIGCGCLRGGIPLIRYLEPGHYFGTDISASLLKAGWAELENAGLSDRVPRANLVHNGDFDFSWSPVLFDFAWAQSVFSHLPIRYWRACLRNLAPVMRPGSSFDATFFEVPDTWPRGQPHPHRDGIVSHDDSDPYHYRAADVGSLCDGLPWRRVEVTDRDHPRGQHLLRFERVP